MLAQIVVCIKNDLRAAGNGTCNTADTLAVVNDSAVVNNGNCTLGAGLNAILAAYTTPGADSICLFLGILVCAGNKVGGVVRNCNNKLLNAAVIASAAAVAEFGIDFYSAIFDDNGIKSTSFSAVAAAYTAICTLIVKETGLYSIGAALKTLTSSVI